MKSLSKIIYNVLILTIILFPVNLQVKIFKDSYAEKGMTGDEMAGWHHGLDGNEFECPPGDLPNPGIEPRSSALRVDSLPAEPQGKSKNTVRATEQIRDTGRLINKALAYVVLKAEESHDLWSQRSGE